MFPEGSVTNVQLANGGDTKVVLVSEAQEPAGRVQAMSKRKRLQFEFTDEAYNDLERLVGLTSAATKAEVMRRALKLFADVVDAERAGHRVYIEVENGVREVIRLY